RIYFKSSVTVQGASADYTSTVIKGDAAWGGGIFAVDYNSATLTVNLKNLHIVGVSDADADGIALLIPPSSNGASFTANLDGVQIDSCNAYSGGAIANYNGTLSVKNSYLHNNGAQFGGGAIFTTGRSPSLVTIDTSRLDNNFTGWETAAGFGGAL